MSDIYKSEAGTGLVTQQYREALESCPVPNEHWNVLTSQGNTFVLVCGPETHFLCCCCTVLRRTR